MKLVHYLPVVSLLFLVLAPSVWAQNASSSDNGTISDQDITLEENYFSTGNDLFDQEKYQDAINQYDKALALVPNDSDVIYQKGRALNNLGQYQEALNTYNKALSLSPNDTDILASKGITLTNLGNPKQALSNFDRALTIDPNDTTAMYRKGLVYQNMTQYGDAIANFDMVLALDPTDTDAMYHKGLVLAAMGNSSGAISYYNKVLEIDPTNTDVLNSKNLAQGRPQVDLSGGANADQNLLEVVVGLFIVILIIILVIDRIAHKRKSGEVIPPMTTQATATVESSTKSSSLEGFEDLKRKMQQENEEQYTPQVKKEIPKKEITITKEEPAKQTPQPQMISQSQELEMVKKLQENNFGNSIMLRMIRQALEQNKPVTSAEMSYLKRKYNDLMSTLNQNPDTGN